jgi:glycosyltransferase involved in cell wall biosynthesis
MYASLIKNNEVLPLNTLNSQIILDDKSYFDTLPFVSVIMPIFNESDSIKTSLGAVLTQVYPENRLQIIVVDGMSNDGTRQIVRELQKNHSNLLLIDNPGKIVSIAINRSLMYAYGDVIIRIDGHTEVAPDYIIQCVMELYRTNADNVGGKMTAIGKGVFGEAVAIATSSVFGVGNSMFHYSVREEWVDTVYMGAWPIRVFEEIGLFDEELVRNQDDEFNYRLRDGGGRILLSPRIKSLYTTRNTPMSLWKQYYQYGYWKVRVLQKHPLQMKSRQFLPLFFVSALLTFALLSPLNNSARIGLICVIGSYLVTCLGVSFWKAYKKSWRYLCILPFVYSILHISYGSGFLFGLFCFANRWRDRVGKVPNYEIKRDLKKNK